MTPIRVGLMGLGRIGRNIFRILYKRRDIEIVGDQRYRRSTSPGVPGCASTRCSGASPTRCASQTATCMWSVSRFRSSPAPARRMSTGGAGRRLRRRGHGRARTRPRVRSVSGKRRPTDRPLRAARRPAGHDGRDGRQSSAARTASPRGVQRVLYRTLAAPVLSILHDAFGIQKALFTSVHAYTNQTGWPTFRPRIRVVGARQRRTSSRRNELGRGVGRTDPRVAGPHHRDGHERARPRRVGGGSRVLARPAGDGDRDHEVVRTAALSNWKGIVDYEDEPIVSTDILCNGLLEHLRLVVDDGAG